MILLEKVLNLKKAQFISDRQSWWFLADSRYILSPQQTTHSVVPLCGVFPP